MYLATSLLFTIGLAATGQQASTVEHSSTVTIDRSDRDGSITVRRDNEPTIEGSGRITRQARQASHFNAIELGGAAQLEVTIGPDTSIEIEGDDNLLDLLTTEVVAERLVIDMRGSFRTRTAPRVRVTMPRLEMVETIGSGDARISGIEGGRLSLAGRGSGDFVVEGRSEALEADMFGSGEIDLAGFTAPDLSVSIYGSGDARANVTGALRAAVFGTGTIAYRGDPSRVRARVYGTGRIRNVGS